MRARLCFRHSDGECLPPQPDTCDNYVLQRSSSHQAPTDAASVWLLHGARQTKEARCVLVFACGTGVQSAMYSATELPSSSD